METRNIRKGHRVAQVAEIDGKLRTLKVQDFPSINAAKKANGLNATTLRRGEPFPPKAEAQAEG